jgi:hypothetical protein
MNPGTPWWNASERMRSALERTVGLTRLRIARDFFGLTATYDVLSDDHAPVVSSPAAIAVPLRLDDAIVGDVLLEDCRRVGYDADARASAERIVAAFAWSFEDPSALVRAQNQLREGRR